MFALFVFCQLHGLYLAVFCADQNLIFAVVPADYLHLITAADMRFVFVFHFFGKAADLGSGRGGGLLAGNRREQAVSESGGAGGCRDAQDGG